MSSFAVPLEARLSENDGDQGTTTHNRFIEEAGLVLVFRLAGWAIHNRIAFHWMAAHNAWMPGAFQNEALFPGATEVAFFPWLLCRFFQSSTDKIEDISLRTRFLTGQSMRRFEAFAVLG
jgi:hypothetical protein